MGIVVIFARGNETLESTAQEDKAFPKNVLYIKTAQKMLVRT
jgi:hypothetical protein